MPLKALSKYVSKKAAKLSERADKLGLLLTIDSSSVWRLHWSADKKMICKNLRQVNHILSLAEYVADREDEIIRAEFYGPRVKKG